MAFDLAIHLESHAFFFKKHQEFSEGNLHFTFSFLDLQFLEKNTPEVMTTLLSRLRASTRYKVANGTRKDKHGNTIQKFTNRPIYLSNEIIAEAIHLKGPEGEDTMPHMHFIIKKEARMGRRYSLLKKHIVTISEEFGLVPHFDEMVEHNPMGVVQLGKATKRLSWSWRKMTNKELRVDMEKNGVGNALKLLQDYALKTNNLTYYIKTLENLKKRLNAIRLDIYHDTHNLRDTYPIPLTKKDMEVIQLIKNKDFSQKSIKPYLKTPILRDFIRYSAKTTTPFIIKALKEQTNLLDGIYKNQVAVKNYTLLTKKVPTEQKSQLQSFEKKIEKQPLNIRKDLLAVTANAINERTLREGMSIAGYFKFGFKKRRGSIIGCFYTEYGKKKNIEYIDIGINWSSIKQTLMENTQKKKEGETLPINNIQKPTPQPTEALMHPTPTTSKPKTVEIAYNKKEIATKKEKEKLRAKAKRIADESRRITVTST